MIDKITETETERKIIHMPGTTLTPEVVLHRTLMKLSRIKSVAIVIQWDDDSMDVDWSCMKSSELCMASMVFDAQARRCLISEDSE